MNLLLAEVDSTIIATIGWLDEITPITIDVRRRQPNSGKTNAGELCEIEIGIFYDLHQTTLHSGEH